VSGSSHVQAHDDDGTCFVRLRGEIDIANADEISKAIDAAAAKSHSGLVLDLTEATYLDSAGVALLFRLAHRLRARRQQMRLVVPHGAPVRAVLDLTGLTRLVPVVDDKKEAAGEVSRGPV
jgi:anti-anti-sigma factor